MKARSFVPRKLDLGAFIDAAASLQGQTPVAELARLAEGLAPEADLTRVPEVRWQVQGRLVPQRVGEPQRWLHLQVQASLPWTCQRCLHPVAEEVQVEREIRFVADEQAAAGLDAELDEDVLALSRTFDLLELIEDELIMASPLVPRHEVCPVEPRMSVADPEALAEQQDVSAEGESPARNPFAVLAQLKRSQGD